jgi:nitroreductase
MRMNIQGSGRRRELIASRYGISPSEVSGDGPWNAVLETMLSRHSVRAFAPDPVPEADLQAIVAAAQSAATSSNLQCCSIVAIQDPERKRRVAALADNQTHILHAPLLLAFVADLSRLRDLGAKHAMRVDGLDYLESVLTGFVDSALAAQNAAVAASSLGWGTCFIGALRNSPQAMARELNLPAEAVAIFGLVVGKPDRSRSSGIKPRLPMTTVLHREQYTRADAAALERYDETMRRYQAKRSADDADWSVKSLNRVGSPEALNGRERLRDELARCGFSLK